MHGRCRTAFEPEIRRTSVAGVVGEAADVAAAALRAELRDVHGVLPVAERAPDERLTDADREQATDLLTAAFRDGVIRVDEFDERLTAALSADTAGELAPVTADLPAQWLAERQAAEDAARRAARRRRRWAAEVRMYAGVMALLVGIWLLTSLGTGEIRYPWPIWPALGWGIPLFLSRPKGPAVHAMRRLRAAREH